jgi:putative FmdB family regulatory protein
MPTYEYRCPQGHDFELFQRMSDEPIAECPICGQTAKRLLSAGAGLLFKGEGFYITDSRPESYRKEASAEKKAESPGGSSDAGGTTPPKKPGADASSSPKKAD